jgi:hypothetical protein
MPVGIQVLLVHLTIHMLALVNLPIIILSGMRVRIRESVTVTDVYSKHVYGWET